MRTLSCHCGIALTVLFLGACGGANSVVGPSSVQMHDGSKTAAAASGQTEAAKRAAWNALSDDEKAAKRAAKKATMQARKAAWNALSDDEKAAKNGASSMRKSVKFGRKAAWNALSDADKAAKKGSKKARQD